ncbi:hypothetical protein ACI65C_013215 [Semiaphis heraclei]
MMKVTNSRAKRRRIQKELDVLNYEWPRDDEFSNRFQDVQEIVPSMSSNQISHHIDSDPETQTISHNSQSLNILNTEENFVDSNTDSIITDEFLEKNSVVPVITFEKLMVHDNLPINLRQQHVQEYNSVDVVPDFWYNNGSCSWAKKTLNVKKFIDRRITPNEIEFDNYSARALSKNIASFSEARTKVKRAQETSELSSNDDDINTRKTRRKICWSPSSADESKVKKSKLPTPPNLIQNADDLEDIEIYDLDMNKSIDIQTQEIFSQNSFSNHCEINADYYDPTKKINKSPQSMPQVLHTSQVVLESTPQNNDYFLSTIDNVSDIKNELKGIFVMNNYI